VLVVILLSLLFGAIVGLSLGLTGGGGGVFAVPLLIYGLGVPAKEAVGISLASVGLTSLWGFVGKWVRREVEVSTGLIFAATGMLGAPLGIAIARQLPDAMLITAFALLMLVIAGRMWMASKNSEAIAIACDDDVANRKTCERDGQGRLSLSSRCAVLLGVVGFVSGTLSGMFGVGGGFLIVPALIQFSSMPMRKAVGTSLLVIALVSVSGLSTFIASGQSLDPKTAVVFALGGIAGLVLGQRIAIGVSTPTLQRLFVLAIGLVASFILLKIFYSVFLQAN
jgi:uncharacterized membrane protein YfcA